MYSRRKNTVSIVCLPPLLFHLICPLHPIPLSVLPSPSQASNGGLSSNYPSSLPSTPVISHRELRGGAGTGVGAGGEGGGSVTSSGSLRNVPQRRTSLFKVSYSESLLVKTRRRFHQWNNVPKSHTIQANTFQTRAKKYILQL